MYGDEPNVAGKHILASVLAQAIANVVVDGSRQMQTLA